MATPETASPSCYYFDDVTVDRQNFRIQKNDEVRSLEPRAFDLLVYLIEQRGRVVEKQELFDRVWKEAFVTDNALTRAIKEIRRAIGDDASSPRYIETLPKRGYRFIAEVKSATDATPAAPAEARGAEDLAEALNYKIVGKLGQGGGGVVYLARDTRLQRAVVLKFLSEELVADERARKRFLREARLASALDHPNICTIFEINEANGLDFIVMQYVEGKTLKQIITGRPLEIDAALAIAIQVADGLAAAHQQKIVHRDIKPGNIVISDTGRVKILDFGLAKSLAYSTVASSEDATELTRQGAQVGTPAYMSPEQVRGEKIDHRSDIFSFGAVLYTMVTGRSPFKGKNKTPVDIMHSVAHERPPSASELNDRVPAELEAIIERAMAKDPGERYQTIQDLLEDLQRLKQHSQSDGAAIRRALSRPRINVRPFAFAALALAMLAVIGVGLQALFRSSSSRHPISSLVVLPFTNNNNDPNSDYLSDGITESIINSLSQVSQLKVMARTTAFRYKGKDSDPQTVAQELKVDGVLTGKVTQQGDSLLVQAELVNAADGTELWGEKYSRKMADILTVQEEIARRISERLRLRLTGEEEKRLSKSYTANTEAYQLYLKGRYYWNKRTEESYQKAIESFRQAIDRDRNYALAYSGLADCYSFLSNQGKRPPREAFPLAKEAAERAIELDDTLAEGHTSLAYVKLYYDWDWKGAEQEYIRAIELNPNYSTPHHGYAYYLISTGRTEEAIAEIQRAQEIDPLSLIVNTDYGEFYYFAHRPAEAIAQLQKAIEMEPSFVRAHFLLGRAYVQKGQCGEAIGAFQKARDLDKDSLEMLGAIGLGYALCGQQGEARKVLDDLLQRAKQRYVSPHLVAVIYAALGDRDEGFAWLDKAFEMRFGPLIYLKVNPIWDPLRSDPRFPDRLRRVSLSP
jgi:serine/threonine-protein kinase